MFSVAVLIGRGLDYKLLREQSFDCHADPLLFNMQLSKDSPHSDLLIRGCSPDFWWLSRRGPPVPIPNTEVKLSSAEDT